MKFPYTRKEQSFDNCAWIYEYEKEDIHNFLNRGYFLGIDERGRPCLLKSVVNAQGKHMTVYRHLSMDEYYYTFRLIISNAA